MIKKLYISLLLLTMPALTFSMEKSPSIETLGENFATAIVIDECVKNEIIAFRKANPGIHIAESEKGRILWIQRIESLGMLGDARRALLQMAPK